MIQLNLTHREIHVLIMALSFQISKMEVLEGGPHNEILTERKELRAKLLELVK